MASEQGYAKGVEDSVSLLGSALADYRKAGIDYIMLGTLRHLIDEVGNLSARLPGALDPATVEACCLAMCLACRRAGSHLTVVEKFNEGWFHPPVSGDPQDGYFECAANAIRNLAEKGGDDGPKSLPT